MIDPVKISELLLDVEAVAVSLTKPFPYASGLSSPIDTNCRVLASLPQPRATIVSSLLEKAAPILGQVDTVAAAGISSLPLAGLLSQRLGRPMVYVRPSTKKHGKGKLVEGALGAGSRVLLVADSLSTETDLPRAVAAIREAGASVVGCASIFSNRLGSSEAFLAEQQIPCAVLTDLATLLECATRRGRISAEQRRAIEDWARDVDGWKQKREESLRSTLDANARKIAQVLLEIDAVSIRPHAPFRYASGILSPIYTDNRLLISHPSQWNLVIDCFVAVLQNLIGLDNLDCLAGTATSGIPHAALIADRLDLPLVYVDFERDKEHGEIQGRFLPGSRTVIIEDHVTTGQSVLASIRSLRRGGAVVPWCVSIFTYLEAQDPGPFLNENLAFRPLCTLRTLLDVAREMNRIGAQDMQSVLAWVSDPGSWQPQSPQAAP